MDNVPASLKVLVKTMGFGFTCNTHARVPVQLDFVSSEKLVDLFEREVLCFGIPMHSSVKFQRVNPPAECLLQKPDHRKETKVEDGEICVCVVSDILNADRSDLEFHCQLMSNIAGDTWPIDSVTHLDNQEGLRNQISRRINGSEYEESSQRSSSRQLRVRQHEYGWPAERTRPAAARGWPKDQRQRRN